MKNPGDKHEDGAEPREEVSSEGVNEALIGILKELEARQGPDAILRFVEGLPATARSPEVLAFVRRAEARLRGESTEAAFARKPCSAEDDAFWERMLERLDARDPERRDASWQLQRAEALAALERRSEALEELSRIDEIAAASGDARDARTSSNGETAQVFECADALLERLAAEATAPAFRVPFRRRVEKAWASFLEEAEPLARRAVSSAQERDAVCGRIREIFAPVSSPNWRFDVRVERGRPVLTLSPGGWRLTAFGIDECIRRAPAAAGAAWTIALGEARRAFEDIPAVEVGGRVLRPEDLCFVIQKEEGDEWRLAAWSEELLGLDEPEAAPVFGALERLVQMTLGEAVQMRWFAVMSILNADPKRAAVSLRELPDFVRERIPAAEGYGMRDYLAMSLEAMEEPERDADCDLLLDNRHYRTRCPPLHNAYGENRPDQMAELDRQGATAGFIYLCFSASTPDSEKRALRDAFRRHLASSVSADALRLTGEGSALRYEYVEFFAWELRDVLEAASSWVDGEERVREACFHTFLRTAGTLRLKCLEPDGGLAARLERRPDSDGAPALETAGETPPDEKAGRQKSTDSVQNVGSEEAADELDGPETQNAAGAGPLPPEENPMTQALVDAVRAYLEKIEVNFDYHDEYKMFISGTELDNELKNCRIVIGVQNELLQCYGISPLSAPPEKLAAMAEYTARANYGLKRGAFELDYADGEIRCHTYAVCPGNVVHEDVVRALLMVPVQLLYKYGDGIVAVLSGAATPEEALLKCEAAPQGEPEPAA